MKRSLPMSRPRGRGWGASAGVWFCRGLSVGDDAGKSCNGSVCPCKLSYQFDSLFAKAAATCAAGSFGGLSHHSVLGVVLFHRHVSEFGVCLCSVSCLYVEVRRGEALVSHRYRDNARYGCFITSSPSKNMIATECAFRKVPSEMMRCGRNPCFLETKSNAEMPRVLF